MTRGRWCALAAILLVIAGGSLEAGLRGHRHALEGPASFPSTSPSPARSVSPDRDHAAGTTARSAPVSLRIPAIGLSVPVSTLGLNPDRTVEVPTDYQVPGWFRLGPSPGQLGSAVILGHVDSRRGPAVFFHLRSLHAGDGVEVTLASGAVAHFEVSTVDMYPKERFPAGLVYGSHGYSALQLVTCGGAFDTRARSYLSNVVVYTSLVAITPPKGTATTTGIS